MNEVFDIVRNLPYQHLVFTFFSVIIGIVLIYIYTYTKNKSRVLNSISLIVILNEIIFQFLLIYFNSWSLTESLPLEMCYISALIVPIYNQSKNNRSLQIFDNPPIGARIRLNSPSDSSSTNRLIRDNMV